MLPDMDTEDFLSSLLDGEDNTEIISPSHSPLGSDSGISDDSSSGAGNNNHVGCPSPHSSDSDVVPSPSYSQPSPVPSDLAVTYSEAQTESFEALTVQADHSYSLLQSGGRDMDMLQSVRAEKPDTDVFIDLGIYHLLKNYWNSNILFYLRISNLLKETWDVVCVEFLGGWKF